MKKNKTLLITSLLILLPCIAGMLLWNQLPDRMPIHFNGAGEADGMGGKAMAVFGLPMLILLFHLIVFWATKLDKQNQTGSNRKVMDMVLYLFPMISVMSSSTIYSIALGKTDRLSTMLTVPIGLLFVIIGNYLPKCRINSTLGIKLPWTFHNEENWNKTHRIGGITWVIGGILQVFFGLMGWIGVMILAALPMALIPVIYSYLLYKKQIASGAYQPGAPVISIHPAARKGGWLSVAIALGVVVLIFFVGGLEYELDGNMLSIDASMHSDLTVDLSRVEKIEFHEENIRGSRLWGYGSPKMAMGTFENGDLGIYTRYTYTKVDAYILMVVNGEYLVLNAETVEATQALYEQILAAMPVLQ